MPRAFCWPQCEESYIRNIRLPPTFNKRQRKLARSLMIVSLGSSRLSSLYIFYLITIAFLLLFFVLLGWRLVLPFHRKAAAWGGSTHCLIYLKKYLNHRRLYLPVRSLISKMGRKSEAESDYRSGWRTDLYITDGYHLFPTYGVRVYRVTGNMKWALHCGNIFKENANRTKAKN